VSRPFPSLYGLLGADGKIRLGRRKGTLGGHRRTKIYGRLDCPAALRAILVRKNVGGGYVKYRVFFANAADARAAGYRPCAVCLADEYKKWKARGATSRRAG
jgi:methylphosphotriester-DNA--protein-cysteine methyltransferase